MTNYCYNELKIAHADRRKIDEVIQAYKAGQLLSYLAPPPDFANSKVFGGLLIANLHKLDQPNASDIHETLARNWKREHWGTARDIIEPDGETFHKIQTEVFACECCDNKFVVLVFRTEGAPPIAAYRTGRIIQGFTVTAAYERLGVGIVGDYRFDHEMEALHEGAESDDEPDDKRQLAA